MAYKSTGKAGQCVVGAADAQRWTGLAALRNVFDVRRSAKTWAGFTPLFPNVAVSTCSQIQADERYNRPY